MNFIALLILLGGFAWLAVLTGRRIQARKQARAEMATRQPVSETQPNQGWRAPWQRPKPKEMVAAFRTWAVATFADQPDCQQWLTGLSDEAVQVLAAKIADFCSDLGFEFDWLLEHKVDQAAALAARLQTIVVQYIEACYQACLFQDDVKVFQAWQDFTQHPYRKEQQALAQHVLEQLLDQGLAPAAAHSLLTAPEKEREIYVVQAVREAAEKRPDNFQAVLKAVVMNGNGITPVPEAVIKRVKRTWLRRSAQEEPVTTPA